MKNLILLFVMCLAAKFSFAQTVHPNIDDDLGFKLESNVKESQRGVANFEKPKPENENNEKSENEKREVAAEQEVFEQSNENGIRYWQYEQE